MTNSIKKWEEKIEIDYSKVPESIGKTIGYTQELVDQKMLAFFRQEDQNESCSLENLKELIKRDELGELQESARELVIKTLLIEHIKQKFNTGNQLTNRGALQTKSGINKKEVQAYTLLEGKIEEGDTVEYIPKGTKTQRTGVISKIGPNTKILMKDNEIILPTWIVSVVEKRTNGIGSIQQKINNGVPVEELSMQEQLILTTWKDLEEKGLGSIAQFFTLHSISILQGESDSYKEIKKDLCKKFNIVLGSDSILKIAKIIFGEEKGHFNNILKEVHRYSSDIIGDSSLEEVERDPDKKFALKFFSSTTRKILGTDKYPSFKNEKMLEVLQGKKSI